MDLLHEMRLAFDRAKRWQRNAVLSGFVVYAAAVASALVSGPRTVAGLGTAALLAQLCAFVSRRLSGVRYALGEEVRRVALLQDSMGELASELQLLKLRDRVGRGKHTEPPVLGQYYASQRPQGAERLIDNLAESSFWTMSLAKSSCWLYGGVAAIGLCALVATLVLLSQLGLSTDSMVLVARIAATTLAVVATGDLVGAALGFAGLAAASERVFDRCDEIIRHGEFTQQESLVLAGDYNCALASAPPIPTLVYRWKQKSLDGLWRSLRASHGTTSHEGTQLPASRGDA